MSETVKIAVIGGSGLYDMPEISDIEAYDIDTPFGKPSNPIYVGKLHGKQVAFLARHGKGHILSPAAVPQRANIYALKSLGVRFIISANACGSLREAYEPGHLAIPDQIIDYNIGTRKQSFFVEGLIAHIAVAEPFDEFLRQQLIDSVKAVGGIVHKSGTFIIEDGPRFATRAESQLFRQWGCDLVGMTASPEAFLAREAEIGYASIAHITDYDSWHEEEEDVNAHMVLETLGKNIALVKKVISHTVEQLNEDTETLSHTALDTALATSRENVPQETLNKLYHIIKRVFNL
jgi:5'-methylthioadenosine phosphorylase